MPTPRETASTGAPTVLAGGGEMGTLMRGLDWSHTTVGPVESWPQSLKTAVSMLLESRFPMYIAWGADYTQFYNDAYRPILGATKHPAALGCSSRETFAEVWEEYVGPLFGRVMAHAEPTYIDDWMLPLDRFGFVEECYFTFCYSAIRNESGDVGGVFVTVVETTARMLGERRVATLRELATVGAQVEGAATVCKLAADTMGASAADIPFALVYLLDEAGRELTLAGITGVNAGEAVAPRKVDLSDNNSSWPLAAALHAREAVVVDDLARRFGPLPGPRWPEPAHAALVLPIALSGEERPYGVLVVGLSPRLAFDDAYRGHLDLVAGQIATAISSVRAYEKEQSRAAALAELDRAKTAFFSNVSHEFRTPLTLMLAPTEDLLEGAIGKLTAEQREHVLLIHRNEIRLMKLVNTLLEFSRIEAGRVAAAYQPTDLGRYTAELASSFRSTVEKAGLTFIVDTPSVATPVYVDQTMWEKIVLNIISNAFKHTFEGSISVSLSTDSECAQFVVRDTGVGIPADHLPLLFDRFHRVPNAHSRTHEGSGIGLALVHELVKLHGGELRVSSQEGVGSEFTVRIPLGAGHLPEEQLRSTSWVDAAEVTAAFVQEAQRWIPGDMAPDHKSAVNGAIDDRGGNGESSGLIALPGHAARIILADDNADVREYVGRLLRAHGWDVTACADGSSALAAAKMSPPDLVLSDVMMPGLEGFGLLRALRADPHTSGVPVILLSARAGEESRIEGMEMGADDYLVKPFSARELVARVGAHLSLTKARARANAEVENAHTALQKTHDLLQRQAQATENALELLRVEQSRLTDLFRQAPAFIAVVRGPDHVFEMANDAYNQLLGFRELVGRKVRDAVPEAAGQGFFELLDGVLATGDAFVGKEIPLTLQREPGSAPEKRFVTFVYQAITEAD
ncbi:MAG TPA: ATP-binding protein, partial [Gemmatimonadaceae bacterium]